MLEDGDMRDGEQGFPEQCPRAAATTSVLAAFTTKRHCQPSFRRIVGVALWVTPQVAYRLQPKGALIAMSRQLALEGHAWTISG